MYSMLKRMIDILLAGTLLLVLSPLMLVVAVAVRLSMGSPVLFSHARPGRGERLFVLHKFRTMRPPTEVDGRPVPDSARITRVGRLLRRTSLDELPQLWNVLRGDMSLVGPRPLFTHYLPYYTERERKRHEVRPGITGLSQVSGRNRLTWEERLDKDVEYVHNRSLALDLKILLLTVHRVLSRQDILDAAPQGSLAEHRENEGLNQDDR